jgi:hypothetical protein
MANRHSSQSRESPVDKLVPEFSAGPNGVIATKIAGDSQATHGQGTKE